MQTPSISDPFAAHKVTMTVVIPNEVRDLFATGKMPIPLVGCSRQYVIPGERSETRDPGNVRAFRENIMNLK